MASADRLAQETQAVREAGQQETSPLSGEEKEVVRETEPETAEAAQETQEPEGSGLTEEQEEEDTRCLHGDVRDFCEQQGLEESLFFALLRKLDMEREQFTKKLEDFSEGQKKKVLIAASLLTPAHLYLWDEPLNFLDIEARLQIEELLTRFAPTMLFVEHDRAFQEAVATKVIAL